MYVFKDPWFLVIIPFLIYLFFIRKEKRSIKVPGIQNIKKYAKKSKKHLLGKILLFFSLCCMVLALCKPQKVDDKVINKTEGIDMIVTLDLSDSMNSPDFRPNRLIKAQEILTSFIDKRENDRIGLVVFGGEAYTKVPLTTDHQILTNMLNNLTTLDITSNNKTAIGMGLGVAINRLKKENTKSKVIILVTDGENNWGSLNPIDAAKLAKDLGIKIYCIKIGNDGGYGMFFNMAPKNDLLEKIAKMTGGEYFNAKNSSQFKEIFNKIDKLEKTEIKSKDFYIEKEYFETLLKVALILLLLGIVSEYLLFIRIP